MPIRKLCWFLTLAFLIAGCSTLRPSSPPALPESAAAPAPADSSAATRLVVCSYNIHAGIGMDKQLDLSRIANVLVGQKTDVAGLQEMDRGVKRTGGVDQLDELKRLTGMAGVFGKSIDLQGGEYGLAILTTGEILEHRHQLHPPGEENERRSLLMARIRFPTGAVAWAINTHLGLNHADRKAQTAALLEAALALDPATPVILLGDFNETPDAPDTPIYADLARDFADAWAAAPLKSFLPLDKDYPAPNAPAGATFPADAPAKRIDYIWLRPASGWTVHRAWTAATLASDHLPLFADVLLEPAR